MRRATATTVILVAATLSGLTPAKAAGFSISGFSSGMTIEQARAALSEDSYAHVQQVQLDAGVTLIASDPTPQGARFLALSFCGGRLYLMSSDLAPSPMNFIKVVDQYKTALGEPWSVLPKTEITSIGEVGNISIVWQQPYGKFSIEYSVFPGNDQLGLIYQDTHLCR
jgi:hypothetical protein